MTDEFRDELPTSSIAEVLVHLRETSVWQEKVYKEYTRIRFVSRQRIARAGKALLRSALFGEVKISVEVDWLATSARSTQSNRNRPAPRAALTVASKISSSV